MIKKTGQPRNPPDPILNLQEHYYHYLNEVHPKKKKKNYEVEFDFIEEKSAIQGKDWNTYYASALTKENDLKNRYPDVLALQSTRVIIDDDEPGCTDYINANFIMSCNGDRMGYIGTQGPCDNSVRDFWRMIWRHNVYVLVMLTKEYENGVQKSSRYWPMEEVPNNKVSYANFEITFLSKERDPEVGDNLLIRKLQVKNLRSNQERTLIHFQYTGWPDHGLPSPSHSHHFLHLMGLVDNAIQEHGGPICLHCSAGIGRTGTFCTIHINIHIIRQYFREHARPPPLSIVSTILRLRKQRAGMVQTKEQFLFCYQIITEEYVRLWEECKARKSVGPQDHTNSSSALQNHTNSGSQNHTNTSGPQNHTSPAGTQNHTSAGQNSININDDPMTIDGPITHPEIINLSV